MDLAKIRKKALADGALRAEQKTPTIPSAVDDSLSSQGDAIDVAIAENPIYSEEVSLAFAQFSHSSPRNEPPSVEQKKSVITALNPVATILAGRVLANCGQEFSEEDDSVSGVVEDSSHEFLCFRVSDEVYGVDIMDIKEIIKPRQYTEVPRSPGYIKGVLSLRGTIVPVIDMRARLGLGAGTQSKLDRIVVVRYNDSLCGLLVDEVIRVVRLDESHIETVPATLDGIDRDFISCIGRHEGIFIIILNLENFSDLGLCV